MLYRTALALLAASSAHAHPLLGRNARVIEQRALAANATYDFVVVGGGIAGLTVADRLTESADGMEDYETG